MLDMHGEKDNGWFRRFFEAHSIFSIRGIATKKIRGKRAIFKMFFSWGRLAIVPGEGYGEVPAEPVAPAHL